jgi:hypothetical protein
MGCVRRTDGSWRYNDQNYSDIPSFSTSIEAAWEVVSHFLETHKHAHVDLSCEPQGFSAEFSSYEIIDISAQSKSAPHAICLAALRAVGA